MICFRVAVAIFSTDFDFFHVFFQLSSILFEFLIMTLLCSFAMSTAMNKHCFINLPDFCILFSSFLQILWCVLTIDTKFHTCPAYYMHRYAEQRTGKKKKHVWIAVLFAISGLICWCGISQVISNSVASSFENAFGIPPIYTTVLLVVVAAMIVLRKNATVKVLDILVPIMAVCYFLTKQDPVQHLVRLQQQNVIRRSKQDLRRHWVYL